MRFVLLFFSVIYAVLPSFSQSNHSFSGYVRSAATGEVLIGAAVHVKEKGQSTSTNGYGFYAINGLDSCAVLTISFVGYEVLEADVCSSSGKVFNFELVPVDNVLEEVVISRKRRSNNVTNPQMGVFNFTLEEVKNVPVLFGERDIMKTIQMLPGVGKSSEGASSFFVRGGGGDQNLILLDEANVYNASHLLGFFSTFNSDALNDVKLFKGGIPPEYGGRVSSVMDVRMLEGNNKKFAVQGGIGLVASRLKLEGPIVKDKSSFMLSGRGTYVDRFLRLSSDEKLNTSKLNFYDFNGKFNYRFNDKSNLFISGYFGRDEFVYRNMFKLNWGANTATVRWNQILSEKLFSNTTILYSDYTYRVNISNDISDFYLASTVENYNLKQDFSFYPNGGGTIKFGVNLLDVRIKPAAINAKPGSSISTVHIDKRNGYELAGYVSHEWRPFGWFSAIYGLRVSNFMVMGPGTFYDYDKDGNPIKGDTYNNSIVKYYVNLEPRVSLSAILNSENSLKVSYNRTAQNLHQLANTTSSLPTDQYIMSSNYVKPQIGDQVALGFFKNFQDNQYEFSVETYYKALQNQIDFRDGADLLTNQFLEGELLFGKGRTYGLEVFLRKISGKLSGWVSYTLGKSERQFDQIDNGAWFNARQDRTHDLSVVGMYNLTKNWTLSANIVYYTGNAVTFPSGKYLLDDKTIYYYSERNGYRMPDYHRIDLSPSYETKHKNKRFNSSWSFGVYNIYNRKNTYIIYFRDNKEVANVTEANKIALFGAVPSVTWNFKF